MRWRTRSGREARTCDRSQNRLWSTVLAGKWGIPMGSIGYRFASFVASLALCMTIGHAAEAGKIDVEFNSLQASEAGCRAVFVLHNGLASALDRLTLRV